MPGVDALLFALTRCPALGCGLIAGVFLAFSAFEMKAYRYASPDASAPYAITSRYEWGVDRLGDKEVYPAHTDRGRSTKGTSEFTVKIEPKNFGVLRVLQPEGGAGGHAARRADLQP